MSVIVFELNVSLPHDTRLVELVRQLAVHAAQQAGYSEAAARAFGSAVEPIVRGYLETADPNAMLPVVVRRHAGPLEVLVDTQIITPRE